MPVRHSLLAILLSAGACSAPTPQVAATVSYTLQWTNTATGDQTPLSSGQGARLRLSLNMSPAVGSIVNVAPAVFPSNNTQGTLRGIQSMILDPVLAGNGQGTWSNLHVEEGWELASSPIPTSGSGGARLANIMAGQFPTNWSSVNPTNPIINIWSGTWTPASYDPRIITATFENGSANPHPFASHVLVRDGNSPLVTVGTAANDFGSIQIPIIPAPSILAAYAISLRFAARRQRRSPCPQG